MNKYSDQLKLKVVKAYLAGKAGTIALGKRDDVEPSLLRRWAAAYQIHGLSGLQRKYSRNFKLSALQQANRKKPPYFDIRKLSALEEWERLSYRR